MASTTEPNAFNVLDWATRIIEGVGGMDDYERYEKAVWSQPERVAAAYWTLRCLSDPSCEGSARMIEAIMERRRELESEQTP